MTAKTIIKKKANEKVKKELLSSLRENDEMNTASTQTEAIELINYYEEIIKT